MRKNKKSGFKGRFVKVLGVKRPIPFAGTVGGYDAHLGFYGDEAKTLAQKLRAEGNPYDDDTVLAQIKNKGE